MAILDGYIKYRIKQPTTTKEHNVWMFISRLVGLNGIWSRSINHMIASSARICKMITIHRKGDIVMLTLEFLLASHHRESFKTTTSGIVIKTLWTTFSIQGLCYNDYNRTQTHIKQKGKVLPWHQESRDGILSICAMKQISYMWLNIEDKFYVNHTVNANIGFRLLKSSSIKSINPLKRCDACACAIYWMSIGSSNDLLPAQRQTISCASDAFLLIGPLGTIFHYIDVTMSPTTSKLTDNSTVSLNVCIG